MNTIFTKRRLLSNISIFSLLVVASVVVRLLGLNLMGHTWDEYAYLSVGDKFVQLTLSGDFNNPEWYAFPDHPPFAKYLYGMAGQLNVIERDAEGIATFDYDWAAPRVVSVLAGALAVGFTFLVGARVGSKQTGIAGAVILMLLPLAIGYSQLITLESIILALSTSTIYFFIRYLEKYQFNHGMLTGVLLGCALATKYTNVLVGLILAGIWICHLIEQTQHHKQSFIKTFFAIDKKIYFIPIISLFCIWLLWPALWLHPLQTVQNIQNWSDQRMMAATEYYFGTFAPVPWHYFLGSLLVTTPVVVLVLLGVGVYFSFSKVSARKLSAVLLVWLLVPLLQSFYPLKQNGIRYVIVLYPAMALMAGYGMTRLNEKLVKINNELPYYIWTTVVGSLVVSLYFVYPYYLDYYNFLTGGNATVYEKRLFEFGYWGQGQREAMMILSKEAQPGSTVGLAVIPGYVSPTIGYLPTGMYTSDYEFDYVLTNAFSEYRSNIQDELINRQYAPVHHVSAGGAPVVTIWASKKVTSKLLLQ